MNRLGLLLLMLPLGACATVAGSGRLPDREWLAGTWVITAPDLHFPSSCSSGLPIGYQPDGTYTMFEESGVWRLERGLLTETATVAHDGTDPQEVAIGRPFTSRIRRIDDGTMVKTFADGTSETLRRCPVP